jgi:octaprenyl-diphosphate synthase
VILAFRRGSEDERHFWKRTLADGETREGDLEQAIELMRKHKALEATLERARYYGSIARDALAIFRDSVPKKALLEVVTFCIARAH